MSLYRGNFVFFQNLHFRGFLAQDEYMGPHVPTFTLPYYYCVLFELRYEIIQFLGT